MVQVLKEIVNILDGFVTVDHTIELSVYHEYERPALDIVVAKELIY